MIVRTILVSSLLSVALLAVFLVVRTTGSTVGPAHASGGACVFPPADLVSWWPGDLHADDIQGGYDGTLFNGAAFAPGKVGPAFSFDGVDDYVATTLINSEVFTWDAWIMIDSFGSYQSIITVPSPHYILMDVLGSNAGSNASFWTRDGLGGHNLGITGLSVGTWHHIAFVREGDSIVNGYKAYLNGKLTGSKDTGTPTLSTDFVRIGGRQGTGQNFPGLIDEVEVFNRALSQPEIQSIFDAGSAGKCKTGGPFTAFTIGKTELEFGPTPGNDEFELMGGFTLTADNDGIDPVTENVVVTVGTSIVTIPAGSFTEDDGKFVFKTELVEMELTGSGPYRFKIEADGIDLSDTPNPLDISLVVGNDGGTATVRLAGELKFENDDVDEDEESEDSD